MSHPDPRHDPENVRVDDSKFAPRAKALKKKMNASQKSNKNMLENVETYSRKKGEAPVKHLKRLLK